MLNTEILIDLGFTDIGWGELAFRITPDIQLYWNTGDLFICINDDCDAKLSAKTPEQVKQLIELLK